MLMSTSDRAEYATYLNQHGLTYYYTMQKLDGN